MSRPRRSLSLLTLTALGVALLSSSAAAHVRTSSDAPVTVQAGPACANCWNWGIGPR